MRRGAHGRSMSRADGNRARHTIPIGAESIGVGAWECGGVGVWEYRIFAPVGR